jgi:hypothetical protein
MIHLLFVLGTLVGTTSCAMPTSRSQVTSLNEVRPKVIATLPLEPYNNLVFLNVRVNGSSPHSFLLDTGADTSVVNETLAQTAHLSAKHSLFPITGTGAVSVKARLARHVELTVGEISLPRTTVVVVGLADLEARIGHEIGGIIGADLFNSFVVTVDRRSETLVLADPKGSAYSGSGIAIPIRLSGDRPFVDARITPVGGVPFGARLVVDTGDSNAIGFHTPSVASHQLRAPTQPLVLHVSKGLNGDSRGWRGRLVSLTMGEISIDRPVASFSEETRGSDADSGYDGVLGGEILRRFRITFDYSRRKMIFEPDQAIAEPYDIDMSGLTLSGRGKDYKTVTVDYVDDGSPAAASGLAIGDIVESVDDQLTSKIRLDELKRLLATSTGLHHLRIRRGPDVFEATVNLRRRV